MIWARIAGVLGYCTPVIAGLIGLSRGGFPEVEMFAASSGFLTAFYNRYFLLTAIGLVFIAIAWWSLPGRHLVFRATGVIVFVAFVLYSCIFVNPPYWFSLVSSSGISAFYTFQGAVFYVLLMPALVQASSMFIAWRVLHQPWFLPAGVTLLAVSILGPLYFAYPNSYTSLLGSEVFSNAALLEVVLLVLVAAFASYSFLTFPAGPSPGRAQTLDAAGKQDTLDTALGPTSG